jgi:ubiquinone/menaquinone biosynthesis C-methylase UbiE
MHSPPRIGARNLVRRLRGHATLAATESSETVPWTSGTYEMLYEAHAVALPPALAIGAGDYDLMGRIMLSALLQEGLEPSHTFVDFGCGTGRLARHVILRLVGGAYIGIDISASMLEQARIQTADMCGNGTDVRWLHQTESTFDLPDGSVDYIAAFSVFTHMEHEDAYLYLRDAHRIARAGARFMFSCLTMDLPAAHGIFLDSTSMSLAQRWAQVRNVTTSYEMMTSIAELAGWSLVRWFKGDEELIDLVGSPGHRCALGQSICVLQRH